MSAHTWDPIELEVFIWFSELSGFLDKNNDLLYRNGKEVTPVTESHKSSRIECLTLFHDSSAIPQVMRQSKNAIVKHCFPATEPHSKRRPETVRKRSEDDNDDDNVPLLTDCCKHHSSFQVVTQFKNSLVGLTEILMSKEPWYVRCIKPNESKQPGEARQSHTQQRVPTRLVGHAIDTLPVSLPLQGALMTC